MPLLLRLPHRIPHRLMPARSLISGISHQLWPVMLFQIQGGGLSRPGPLLAGFFSLSRALHAQVRLTRVTRTGRLLVNLAPATRTSMYLYCTSTSASACVDTSRLRSIDGKKGPRCLLGLGAWHTNA
ncbi:hypothetical protein J3F83DRAFT_750447 [Trichoderma novae-zelandiae]